jgi:fumarate reductase flavoprotein subunit
MPVAPPGLRWQEEVDIGVVGAGGCGLAAAHAAAQPDLKTVIWERGKTAGGSTTLSGGRLAAAGSRMQHEAGIFETSEEFVEDVLAHNGGRSDPAVTRRLCESSASLVEWLADARGIPLDLVKQVCDPGHRRFRLHAPPARSGQALVTALLRSLERRGARLRLETAVLQLWTDDAGAVIGTQIKAVKKTPSNVRCGKLILATGGFGANPTLMAEHCPAVAGLNYIGASTNDGDALNWSADVGAATRDLGAYEAHATVAVGSQLLVPWMLITNGALVVNQRGERFADETRGPAAVVMPLLAQPGRIGYELFDARILKLATTEDPQFAAEVVPRAVRRGDTLASLAEQFQIDLETLTDTVAQHSAAGPVPLVAPFYGIRIGPGLLQTLGGLVIDGNARVLGPDGTPIPNLYAGGGAAAGCSGPAGDGYLQGMGLLCALGWGKIAGEQAAHELRATRAALAQPSPEPHDEPASGE